MSREYVDDVDLMKKIKASEFAALVAEEKWSEQLRGLQLVIGKWSDYGGVCVYTQRKRIPS